MDPQPPQPTRAPAAAGQPHHHQNYEHHQQYAHSHQHDPDLRYGYGEKDRGPRRQHDSVISHPFSPKASSPPSPASSVSSSSRRHEQEQEPHATVTQPVAYPPPAHMDPEKAAYSARERDANVTTILYDSSVYPEKGPEEKPVQLLVSPVFAVLLL